jgi:type II secretory pathway component GspD/PulD (secretin)
MLDSGLSQPIISTRDYKGSIVIRDNHTIGIGGLYREDISKSKSMIPVVGEVPLFGNLFTSRNEGKSRSELVIFVTARIDRNIEYEIRAMEAARAAVQSATGEGGS